MNNIAVSIFILTYNQEQFIAQTIESILSQKTNFNFQLVIGEDCSSDNTRTICEQYAHDYGEKVKLLPALHSNIGLMANYIRTIKECNGKYIAICDGDDYWTDDLKLQKQVDFLENNQDYSIVYTAVNRLYPDGKSIDFKYSLNKTHLDFDDLVFDNFISSVTALFRNTQSNLAAIPGWINNFPFGDWQTYLWVLKDGSKIHFMEDITAVYRMNIGVSSTFMKKNSVYVKVLIDILQYLYEDENFSHKKEIIAASIINRKRDLLTCYNREKTYVAGFGLFLNVLKTADNKLLFSKFYLYSLFKSLS